MRLEDYKPSAPADVSCISEDGKSTLIFVREIRHSPARVWSAMIDAGKIPKWAPYGPNRNLDSLGPVTLKMFDGSTPEKYQSEVLEVIPEEKLKYSWGDNGVLCWLLEPVPEGTRLTLRHTVDNPDWITPAAAGWHMCLDFAEILLDGYAIGPILGESVMDYGWGKLAEHYGNVLGMPVTDQQSGKEE